MPATGQRPALNTAGDQLGGTGIPLVASDEPVDAAGMSATTLLLRRMKQSVAEWYRYETTCNGFWSSTILGPWRAAEFIDTAHATLPGHRLPQRRGAHLAATRWRH